MKKKIFFTILLGFLASFCLHAQKRAILKITNGSLDFLKEQKVLLVTYDYNNMSVGKFVKEEDYINMKVAKADSIQSGKGDEWKKEWFDRRSADYEPSFEESFNKYMRIGLTCSKNANNAAYIMDVHTVFTDVGFFAGITGKVSFISAKITFSQASSGEELAVIYADKCPGTGYYVKDAYASLGKKLAKWLNENL
jgi:hypothetical protein